MFSELSRFLKWMLLLAFFCASGLLVSRNDYKIKVDFIFIEKELSLPFVLFGAFLLGAFLTGCVLVSSTIRILWEQKQLKKKLLQLQNQNDTDI